MADELPDSIPAAIPATDPSQRLPHVQGEIDGMRAVPDTGCEPWATRLDPPHPGHVAKAAGALTAITASRKHAYMVAYTLDDAGLLAVDGDLDLSALADACDDLVRAYHARDADTVPPVAIHAVRVALGQPVEPIVDGDLDDFTAALAAADVKWAHDLGDEQSAPAYIQSLASTVWSLWIQPRLAGTQSETVVDGDLRGRCISALDETVSEYISPNEFGGYDINYGELVDVVLAEVQPELERGEASSNRLVQELLGGLQKSWNDADNLRASREAWAIEANRLDVIAVTARYYVRPGDCNDADCDHDDDVCLHLETRYATNDDAIRAGTVPGLESHNERLLQIAASYAQFAGAVADALGLPASTSNDDLIATLSGHPAIPADTVVLPENWESQIRWALNTHVADICAAGSLCEDKVNHDGDAERCADDIAGDIATLINDWLAPAVCSDTTAGDCGSDTDTTAVSSGQPRTWTYGDPEPEADVTAVQMSNSQRFVRLTVCQPDTTFWRAGIGAMIPWNTLLRRAGTVTEVVPAEQTGDAP